MKISLKLRRLCALALSVILIAGCTSQSVPGITPAESPVRTWIDQPRDGSTIPLAPMDLLASAREAPGDQISTVQFLVNGVNVGAANLDREHQPFQAQVSWNPPGPGRYTIQALSIDSSGAEQRSQVSHICVSGSGADCPEVANPVVSTQQPTQPASVGQPSVLADPPVAWFGQCTNRPMSSTIKALPVDLTGVVEVDVKIALVSEKGERSDFGIFQMTPQNGEYEYRLDASILPPAALGNALLVKFQVLLMNEKKEFFPVGNEGEINFLNCAQDPQGAGASPTPNAPVTVGVSASPADAWFGSCTSEPATVTFQVNVSDPSSATEIDIQLAVQNANGERRDAGLIPLQPTSMPYVYTISTATLPTYQFGDELSLIYKASLLNNQKQYYASSPEEVIRLHACRVSTSTPAPQQQPTYTPTTAPVIPLITNTPVPLPQKPTGKASSSEVFYINGCGPNTLTVYAHAQDASGVKRMRVHWIYVGGYKNPGTEKIFEMTPTGNGGYSLVIMDPTDHTAYPNLNGGNGQIQYWFEVLYGSGAKMFSDPANVAVTFCPG